ncbi:hypothetical protein B1218_35510, partial [Pseudomonas ogarae]
MSLAGMLCGLLALVSITAASIIPKRITDNPLRPLPVQYLPRLMLRAALVPVQPLHLHHTTSFFVPLLWLGGGSNVLLMGGTDGEVVHMGRWGSRSRRDGCERVVIESEAGEPWHRFVLHTLALGWAGLENLILSPGTVGAAPMQN